MKEFKTIVSEYSKIDFSKQKAALATVVKVRGSSYRSPGARMLITDDGKWVGSISGGCLEGDALRKARQVMTTKQSLTVTYDTNEDSNQNLGIGLGCNGVIDVFIECIDPADPNNPVTIFESFTETDEPLALATVFSASSTGGGIAAGQKFLVGADAHIQFNNCHPNLTDVLAKDLASLFGNKNSEAKLYVLNDMSVEVFIEIIQPTVSLIIFGGGFDARPVSAMAKSLGWNVSVTDECVAHIAPVFFPTADKLSLCERTFIDRDFKITPFTACVLMSHNYEYDRDVLRKLIGAPTPYIGILGPRKRFDRMLEELKKEGVHLTNDDLHKVHSPIGLDIGAETPDEIALSIISEIQGKFTNRSGGFLKYRKGPIHHRDTNSDQVFKQVYISSSAERPSKTAG